MTMTNFENRGPEAAGEAMQMQHSKLYTEALSVITDKINPHYTLLHSQLTDQVELITELQNSLNLTLSKDDLEAATKMTVDEITRSFPTLGGS